VPLPSLPTAVPLPSLPTAVPLPTLPTAVPLPTLPTTILLTTTVGPVLPVTALPTIDIAADADGNDPFVTLTAGNHFTNFTGEANVGINITRRGHKVRRGWNGNFTSESANGPDLNSTAGSLLGADGNFTAGGGVHLYCTQVFGF
jgi:hypothetical protein